MKRIALIAGLLVTASYAVYVNAQNAGVATVSNIVRASIIPVF